MTTKINNPKDLIKLLNYDLAQKIKIQKSRIERLKIKLSTETQALQILESNQMKQTKTKSLKILNKNFWRD